MAKGKKDRELWVIFVVGLSTASFPSCWPAQQLGGQTTTCCWGTCDLVIREMGQQPTARPAAAAPPPKTLAIELNIYMSKCTSQSNAMQCCSCGVCCSGYDYEIHSQSEGGKERVSYMHQRLCLVCVCVPLGGTRSKRRWRDRQQRGITGDIQLRLDSIRAT